MYVKSTEYMKDEEMQLFYCKERYFLKVSSLFSDTQNISSTNFIQQLIYCSQL